MQNKFTAAYFYITVIAVILLLSNCAIRVSPQGGAKDITPPKFLKSTPENYSVNFSAKEFTIHFDELIDLKDVNLQLIVSPLLKNTPDIKTRGKDVVVQLEDTLKPNTTYTFNFGKSITDVHEGNVLENFQFVFATGNHLDSLQLGGKVEFASSLKTEAHVSVMLYDSDDDSCIYKTLPDYFATTNEEGNFVFKNLRAGMYKIMALKDANNNYMCDGTTEAIAFLENQISVSDTSQIKLRLFIPEEKQSHFLKSRMEEKNKVLLLFTSSVPDFSFQLLDKKLSPQNITTEFLLNKDSIILWIADTIADSLNIVLVDNGVVMDTTQVQLKSENKQKVIGRGMDTRATIYSTLNTNGEYLEAGTKALLTFNRPLKNLLKENILLFRDSLPQKDFTISNADSLHRKFYLNYKFTENHKYTLLIPKETATDFVGYKNDSITINFLTRKERDYGSIELTFTTTSTNKHFIIQLVSEDDFPVREFFTDKSNIFKIENLLPGKFRLKLIEDANHNKKWDTGDYSIKLQPEKVIYYNETINVRSNWDVELNWKVE